MDTLDMPWTATSFVLQVIMPLVLARLRRYDWSSEWMGELSIGTAMLLYLFGQALDGYLTLESLRTPVFWSGLVAASLLQQGAYKLWPKATINKLEKQGPDGFVPRAVPESPVEALMRTTGLTRADCEALLDKWIDEAAWTDKEIDAIIRAIPEPHIAKIYEHP